MKRFYWMLGVGFFTGILLANLMGTEILNSYGVLNSYFLKQFVYCNLNYESLATDVFLQRLRIAAFLILLDLLVQKSIFEKILGVLFSFMFGIFITASISNFGLKGILLVGILLFPQWIFYVGAFLLFLQGAKRREQRTILHYATDSRRKNVLMLIAFYVIFVLVIVAGSLTETYINPLILKKILKIF